MVRVITIIMSDHPDPTHRSLITSSIAFIISLKTFLFVFSQAGQGRRYCIGNIEINEQRKVIFSRIPSSGKSPDRGYFYNQSELEDNKDGRVWRERSKNYFIQLLLLLTSLIFRLDLSEGVLSSRCSGLFTEKTLSGEDLRN